MDKETKPQQKRMTFSDTRNYFQLLKKFIRKKVQLNLGISSEEEENEFVDYWENSALSHGMYHILIPIKGYGNIEFRNISTFVDEYINACAKANYKGNTITITDCSTGFRCQIEHKVIWELILKKISELKPHALEEAIHMSAERPSREAPTSYKFKSE